MQFIDTHCHIHSSDYPLAVDTVEKNAQEANVTKFICVGTGVEDSQQAVAFAQHCSHAWASVGLHPHDAKEGKVALQALERLIAQDKQAKNSKIVAVGECGLDYFYGHSSKKAQENALRFQIELALQYNLVLIFHVREAFDDFWPIFDHYSGIRGVLHSFTDTGENLDRALTRNLLIGLNGIMTFTKNDWQLAVAKTVPLTNLVLETDAPFLTPKPYRGTVNEPARVRTTADFLAELRHEDLEIIAKATTTNARQLFSI